MTKKAKDHDRALAMAKIETAEGEGEADGDAHMEDAEETPAEMAGSKVIVIHMGSQNLRIGLASDALPKTLPMVIARKAATNESEDHDEPKPKRFKHDDGSEMEPEKAFGPEVRSVQFYRDSRVLMFLIVVVSFQSDVCGFKGAHATEQAKNASKLQGDGS